jgi:hypothetical protein
VFRLEPESRELAKRNAESLDVDGDTKKTPGALALGVSCQPVGSESSPPNVRLPE